MPVRLSYVLQIKESDLPIQILPVQPVLPSLPTKDQTGSTNELSVHLQFWEME